MQGFAEYQRRLKESLAAIMQPTALAGALPVMPGLSAGLAALSERLPAMPAMPSMASLPRLPSMAELSRSKLGPGSRGVTVRARPHMPTATYGLPVAVAMREGSGALVPCSPCRAPVPQRLVATENAFACVCTAGVLCVVRTVC